MTTPRPILTVGDLIEKLSEFDPDAPIRAQHALADKPDLIVTAGAIPNLPGVIAIIYMPPPSESQQNE